MHIIPLSPGISGSPSSPAPEPFGLVLPIAPRQSGRLLCAPAQSSDRLLLPDEALALLQEAATGATPPDSVLLLGPGDPLALIEPTLATLRRIRQEFPQMGLSLATLGLHGAVHAAGLKAAGLDQVCLQVATVDEQRIGRHYAWIRPGTRTVPLQEAGPLLIREQRAAASAFLQAGIRTTLHVIVGHPDDLAELAAVAEQYAALGVREMTIFSGPAMLHEDGVAQEMDLRLLNEARTIAGRFLTAVSLAARPVSPAAPAACRGSAPDPLNNLPRPTTNQPNVAVASAGGMEVDLHLGQAGRLLIYGPREDGLACLLETRTCPEPGGGNSRWQRLAETIADCFVLLTTSAGPSPRKTLAEAGIRVMITEDSVEGLVDVLYGGGKKGKKKC